MVPARVTRKFSLVAVKVCNCGVWLADSLWLFNWVSKSVQVLLTGVEAVMVILLFGCCAFGIPFGTEHIQPCAWPCQDIFNATLTRRELGRIVGSPPNPFTASKRSWTSYIRLIYLYEISVYLSIHPSICLYMSIHPYTHLSIHLSIYQAIYL